MRHCSNAATSIGSFSGSSSCSVSSSSLCLYFCPFALLLDSTTELLTKEDENAEEQDDEDEETGESVDDVIEQAKFWSLLNWLFVMEHSFLRDIGLHWPSDIPSLYLETQIWKNQWLQLGLLKGFTHHNARISCRLERINCLYSEIRNFLPSTMQVRFGRGRYR